MKKYLPAADEPSDLNPYGTMEWAEQNKKRGIGHLTRFPGERVYFVKKGSFSGVNGVNKDSDNCISVKN